MHATGQQQLAGGMWEEGTPFIISSQLHRGRWCFACGVVRGSRMRGSGCCWCCESDMHACWSCCLGAEGVVKKGVRCCAQCPLTWLVAPQLNSIPQRFQNCVLWAFQSIAEGWCLPGCCHRAGNKQRAEQEELCAAHGRRVGTCSDGSLGAARCRDSGGGRAKVMGLEE